MKRVGFPALASALLFLVGACRLTSEKGGGEGQGSAARAAPRRPSGWRGDGTGGFPDASPCTDWDADEGRNILWKAKVGESYSSPVVADGRLFLTCEEERLLCLNAATGEILWEKTSGFGDLPPELNAKEKRHPTDCGFSTPSPATDGGAVYVSFGTGIVACYGVDGERRWIRYFDLPQIIEYGRSASPILAGGRLLVSINHLIALDPETGETAWEAKDSAASYGTPAAARIGDVEVVITPAGDCVRVSDGKVLAKDIATLTYTSPLVRDGVVYFAGSWATAFRLPGEAAEGMEFEELWEAELGGDIFSSPVLHDGILYAVDNEGMLRALDAEDGEVIYEKHLEIPSAGPPPGMPAANIYASLTAAGGRLFLGNDAGDWLVLAPGRGYKETSVNSFEEGTGASPFFDGKRLFLRAGEDIYCIGSE